MPEMGRRDIALTQFAGRAGDRNDRAMVGSRLLTASLATRFGVDPVVIGEQRPALSAGWEQELTAALPELRQLAQRYQQLLENGGVPVTALSRCAVALATLPVVAAHRSDTVFVWFDAHADLNTPQTSTTGYLGGLAFGGSLGLWASGLGNGVLPENAVLVGARDIDPSEQQLIDNGEVQLVKVATDCWRSCGAWSTAARYTFILTATCSSRASYRPNISYPAG
jgi:arginase